MSVAGSVLADCAPASIIIEHRAVRPHWHIDYLRRHTRLESVWYRCGVPREHDWAAQIAELPTATTVLLGFGSSDCGCDTHLFWFEAALPVAVLKADFAAIKGPYAKPTS